MKFSLIVLASLFSTYVFGQNSECAVLLESISGSYSGECKKGKAHGEGKSEGKDIYAGDFKKGFPHGTGLYTWRNGKSYEGKFFQGKKHGKGQLKFYMAGKDSIMTGYWRNDEYIGLENIPLYQVVSKRNIDRISIRENKGGIPDVKITFIKNGVRHGELSDLRVASESGAHSYNSGEATIEHPEFPLFITINYKTPNKMKSAILDVRVEVKINFKGSWQINLYN